MRSDTAAERAARRRFTFLALLHQRPHSTSELIALLDKENLFECNGEKDTSTAVRQRLYQFRHDINALRLLGCQLTFDRKTRSYTWHNSPFGLSLNQSQLATFAMLLNTFADTTVLHASEIQALLTFLKGRLPPDQQKVLDTQRRPFSIDLHETTDYRNADPQTVERIEKAIQRGQQLEFRHRSPREGKERRHVIEPQPLVFERGHVYLHGWSHCPYQRKPALSQASRRNTPRRFRDCHRPHHRPFRSLSYSYQLPRTLHRPGATRAGRRDAQSHC